MTIPCVTGPYTSVNCTLTLTKSAIRTSTSLGDNYVRASAEDDRFSDYFGSLQSIVTSTAQNDSGLFETNLHDERYLPFEGSGAIGEWQLQLPGNPSKNDPLQFDYDTISDVILHLRYTAREGGELLKKGAIAHLRDYFSQDGTTPSLRMFNLRQEFPSQWQRFLNPTNPADGNVFELEMIPSLFPIRDAEKTLKVNTIWLLARCTDPGSYGVVMTPPLPAPPPPGSNTMTLTPVNQYGGLHFSQKDVATLEIEIVPTADPPVKWHLKMTRPGGGNLQEDPVKKVMEVEDLLLVLGYEWHG